MHNYQGYTLFEAVEKKLLERPNATAIYYKGKKISGKSFLKRIDNAASLLVNKYHIKKGDVILIAQPNIPDCLVMFYAVNKIGAIANMVHPFTPYNQILQIYKKTHSKLAILFEQRIAKEVERYREFPGQALVTRIEDDLPIFSKLFYHIFMNGKIRKKLGKYRKFGGFAYLSKQKTYKLNTDTEHDDGSVAVLLHSGSTTGDPKTICLANRPFNYIDERTNELYCESEEELVGQGMLSVLPSFHGFGLCMTMHLPFINGMVCVLVPKFSAKEVVEVINKTRINCLIGVPNMYEKLLNEPNFVSNKNLKNIHICYCGGDGMSLALQENFNKVLEEKGAKGRLFQGYGLTEAVAVNCVNNFDHNKPNSLGYPISGAEFVILDEAGNKLKPNEIGEICFKSEAIMIGYYKDENATKEALRDGYLHTGDLGYIDEDGFIFFKQRAKRVIKVSGVGVFPSEVENFVCSIPGVKECCAIQIPDNVLIHAIKLFVVAGFVDEEGMRHDIIKRCQKYLIKWSVPKEVEFVKELPLTPLGKVNFRYLQEQEDLKRGITK